ncbi:MAG: HEAT repeat domain-containing protein [Methanoregula sp.]|jgi:HEAT repeat protein
MGFFELFRPDVPALFAQKDYPGLVQALQYSDPEIVRDAAAALKKAGPAGVPTLLSALSSSDKKSRPHLFATVLNIDSFPVDDAVPVIMEMYQENPEEISRYLFGSGASGMQFLGKLLASTEKKSQNFAILILRNCGEPAWPALVEALSAQSHLLRANAAKVLTLGGWKPKTEEDYVRLKAAVCDWKELVRIKKPAVPVLVNLLSDPYYGVRRDAAEALGRIGDPRAVLPLCALLHDSDPEICVSAAEALRNIPDKRAVQHLVKALAHPVHTVCFAAANTLAEYDWAPSTDQEKFLFDLARENWKALAAMGRSALPGLVCALGDGYYGVRQGAAGTLMQMGGAGRDALVQAQKSDNPTIRQTAQEYLARSRNYGHGSAPAKIHIDRTPVDTTGHGEGGGSGSGRPSPTVHPDQRAKFSPTPGLAPLAAGPQPVRPDPVTLRAPDTRPVQQREPDAPREPVAETPGKTILEVPVPDAKKPGAPPAKDISSLLAALKSPDEDVRMIAVESLVKYGEEASDPLISSISDPSARVRAAVAEALGKIRCERAVPGLSGLLLDGDEEVRCSAASALGAIGDIQGFAPLARLFADEYQSVREAAVSAVAALGGPAVPFLLRLLSHDAPKIRVGAASALGATGAPGAAAPLAALFADPDPEVRESAAKAVGSLGVSSLNVLERAITSRDPLVRLCGVTALCIIGEPARDLLVHACQDPDPAIAAKARQLSGAGPDAAWESRGSAQVAATGDPGVQAVQDNPRDPASLIRLINSPNKDVVIKAVGDLVQAGESSVQPLVQALLHEKDEIRAGAAEALVVIGKPSVQPLLDALQDATPEEKIWIIHTLGKLGDHRAVGPVGSLLFDHDLRLQQAAMEALGYIGDSSVSGIIAGRLQDRDERIREVAARVLGYIGDPSSARLLIPALGDEEYTVREVAGDALFEIGEPAIPALAEALKNHSRDIREAASGVLGRLDWKPATPDERVYLLMAQENWIDLARMGSEVIGPLTKALESGDEELHMGVIVTLGKMASPETVGLLARALVDRNVMVRQKAMRVLLDMGETARQPLLDFASGSPAEIRQATEDVIARIDRRVHS